MSECEFKSIPAILILNYVDTPSTVDTLTLEGFRKTFFSTKQAIQLKGVIPIKDSGNILKSISKRINGDDLYL